MSMECPYCECDLEDPDPDFEYNQEDKVYEYHCRYCDKNFIFTLSYSVDYYPEKADCLNGAPHDWRQMHGDPKEYFDKRVRCSICDKVTTKDEVEK